MSLRLLNVITLIFSLAYNTCIEKENSVQVSGKNLQYRTDHADFEHRKDHTCQIHVNLNSFLELNFFLEIDHSHHFHLSMGIHYRHHARCHNTKHAKQTCLFPKVKFMSVLCVVLWCEPAFCLLIL